MFFCPDCHVSNRSDAKFCRKCGKSRSDLERAEVSVAVVDVDVAVAELDVAEVDLPVAVLDVAGADVDVAVVAGDVDNQGRSGADGHPTPVESTLPVGGEEAVTLQVAADAPALAVNIEQEMSLSPTPDSNLPECPSCWKALRATDKFCCWCGEAQPNRVLPFLKLCLECSTFLPEKANYCYSCGTDVGYSSRRKVRVPHELFKDEESEFFPRFDA